VRCRREGRQRLLQGLPALFEVGLCPCVFLVATTSQIFVNTSLEIKTFKETNLTFSSSPPVLKYFEGMTFAAAVKRFVVKLTVAGEARVSCPAGGSLANVVHGLAWLHAMCSGWLVAIIAVCPGESISCEHPLARNIDDCVILRSP
jgi:hypothetical protein